MEGHFQPLEEFVQEHQLFDFPSEDALEWHITNVMHFQCGSDEDGMKGVYILDKPHTRGYRFQIGVDEYVNKVKAKEEYDNDETGKRMVGEHFQHLTDGMVNAIGRTFPGATPKPSSSGAPHDDQPLPRRSLFSARFGRPRPSTRTGLSSCSAAVPVVTKFAQRIQ